MTTRRVRTIKNSSGQIISGKIEESTTRSLYPLSLLIGILLLCLIQLLLDSAGIIERFIYSMVFCSLWYGLFCRYSSKLVVTSDSFKVVYFNPMSKVRVIPIANLIAVDVEKGFYDLSAEKSIVNHSAFPQYCYDKIILYTQDDVIVIEVNTICFGCDKVVFHLRKLIGSQRN